MRKADRAAMGVVAKKAASLFEQRLQYCQHEDKAGWDFYWRRVRVRCQECEEGYYVPRRGCDPQCGECSDRMTREVFRQTKGTIVLHLYTGENVGPLAPYLMVEPKDRVA